MKTITGQGLHSALIVLHTEIRSFTWMKKEYKDHRWVEEKRTKHAAFSLFHDLACECHGEADDDAF